MAYNSLTTNVKYGVQIYIDDLNKRLEDLLFNDGSYYRLFSGLARIDIDEIPRVNDNGEYVDALFNDNYDISSFYVISGDEKIRTYSTESKLDLIMCVNMDSFPEYTDEQFIEKVYSIMVNTAFASGFDSIARDVEALKELKYDDRITETMRPFFVFRIKNKLLTTLKN